MTQQPDPTDNQGWIQSAIDDYEGPLLRYANHFVHDVDTARDIVQDTFLRLCRQNADDVRPKLAKWLFTVCRNRAIDIRRKESRMTPAPDYQLAQRPDVSSTPEQRANEKEAAQGLLKHVATLPERQQELLRLKFTGGLSYRQIAEVTGLTVSNVGVTLHTAISKLRQRMVEPESA